MSDYFNDIYLQRLNRYGLDYKSRVLNQRKKEFNDMLLKSAHRLDFDFNGDLCAGILNSRKQDETKTMQNLLTKREVEIPNGTILNLNNSIWMVYWIEDIPDNGYNKYVVLKMTHFIKWIARDKKEHSTWAYLYGQEDNMLKDELKSRSRNHILYTENLKESFFICPTTVFLRKEDYLEIGEGELKEAFVVTGYDMQSTPGVEYVSIDPVYVRDSNPTPTPAPDAENTEDYFWLNGGM